MRYFLLFTFTIFVVAQFSVLLNAQNKMKPVGPEQIQDAPEHASPGHRGYIFTILVGRTEKSLIQYFKEEHRHLRDKVPGIGDMRDLFK